MNAPEELKTAIRRLIDDPRLGGKMVEAKSGCDRTTLYSVMRTGRVSGRTIRRLEASGLISTISTT